MDKTMTILQWVWKILQGILASIGMSALMLVYICLFTSYPEQLFNTLKVETKLHQAEAIVVLGAGVTREGWPDRRSLERTVKAVILYKKGYAPVMIFAGGWEHHGYKASVPVMAKVAQDLGVPENAIIIEDKSHDTYQNALFTQAIMRDHDWNSLLLVTSESHMKRAALTFNKLGMAVYPVPVEESLPKQELSWRSKIQNFAVLYHVLYEAAGGVKYKMKGWV